MIVSRKWLTKYFDAAIPSVAEIADAFTFHAFEIEEATDDTLDVKVLPNRAADCMSHRGIARELGAIRALPMKPDPFRLLPKEYPKAEEITITVEDARACPRYMAALVKGVTVGPSPAWLREALESVGQRSINNVVDATNYVMLDLGQPLHAFDAEKMKNEDGVWKIAVRGAVEGESIETLSGDAVPLAKGMLLITDGNADAVLGIAGVKGGMASAVSESTTDLIIESANFDGAMVRKTSQKLKLWTDASRRFQNSLSPELASYGMDAVVALIQEIAGGEIAGVRDYYPAPAESVQVPVSVSHINHVLGTEWSGTQVENVFHRLGLAYKKTGEDFTVDPPFERRDLTISADLVEEVGRIIGYDGIEAKELPPLAGEPDQARFRGTERMKDQLVEQGFTELSTQSFAKKGDLSLANPLDVARPYLRVSLEENLNDALEKAKQYAPLLLPPKAKPKLFEVGTVFPKEGEYVELRMTEAAWDGVPTHDNLSVAKLEDYGKGYEPKRYALGAFTPYSAYPFIVRDIALWTPSGTPAGDIESAIRNESGALLVRLDQFDRFEKEGRVSYAFRLVFQSFDRTLTDDEVNGVMAKITTALTAAGYEVR